MVADGFLRAGIFCAIVVVMAYLILRFLGGHFAFSVFTFHSKTCLIFNYDVRFDVSCPWVIMLRKMEIH